MEALWNSPRNFYGQEHLQKEAPAPDVNFMSLCPDLASNRIQDGTCLHLLFQQCEHWDHSESL